MKPSRAYISWMPLVLLNESSVQFVSTSYLPSFPKMAYFSRVLSLESAFLIWTLVFFTLFYPNTLNCHLLFWPVLLIYLALSSFPSITLSVKSSNTVYRKLSDSVLLSDFKFADLWNKVLHKCCLDACPLTYFAHILCWCTLSNRSESGLKVWNVWFTFSSKLKSQSKFERFMNLNYNISECLSILVFFLNLAFLDSHIPLSPVHLYCTSCSVTAQLTAPALQCNYNGIRKQQKGEWVPQVFNPSSQNL